MKKRLMIVAGILLATNTFASSINIDVDLGGVGNVLEHVENNYYKAFYDDNGILRKADIRLRAAKNANVNGGEVTTDGINAIFNLVRGTLVLDNVSTSSLTNPISTNESGVIKKDFNPGIQIYSSNNIQIKRGYLFSQEFLKFFNTNLLLEGVKNYTYTAGSSLTNQEKIKNATLLMFLDKFNVRSFSMYFDDNINSKYTDILNGLSNLESMIDNVIKEDSYKKILKEKIHSIKTLLKFSKAVYDSAKNANIEIKRYKITGNNKIEWATPRNANLLKPFIEVFPTNEKDANGDFLYAIDKTHIKHIRAGNSYCSKYTKVYCPWNGTCYEIFKEDDNYYYYHYTWDNQILGTGVVSKKTTFIPLKIKTVCKKTVYCSVKNIPPNTASEEIKRSYAQNCFYNIDVNTAKEAVKNVLDSLNSSYENMVNNIFINTAKEMNIGTQVKDTLKYLTNNVPNLTDIMLSISQSYAIRDINALYRKNSDINMIDFMDDIQEVVGLKQYKYNKDLDVLRSYKTALSLSDFSNNSLPQINQEQLSQQIDDAIQTSQEIANSSNDTEGSPSLGADADKYIPITPSDFLSIDDNTGNSYSTLAAVPIATTSSEAVSPDKMLIIYINPFDAGAQSIIFGGDVANVLNNYLTTDFDSGLLANYDIFGYGINKKDGKKYYLGAHYLDDSQKLDYLKNSFALFGEACTKTDSDNVCSLASRNVSSTDNWIDIGANNILYLYNTLISKIGTENNVFIDNKDLTATLNEIIGILVDSSTGDTAQKLVSILNGDKDTKDSSMKVDTFMPFKGEGLLVQTHYEIKHYKIVPDTEESCDKDGNCTTIITGYKWGLDYISYPNYSCKVAFHPTSKIATMLISKTYGNYVNGQLSTTNVTYNAIGTTKEYDFAKLLSTDINATNENTVISGENISYKYEELANPNLNYTPNDADCLAHGFQPGCTAEDIGVAVNCSDMGGDDFWNSHAVIEFLNSISINGVGNSTLVYKNDINASNDEIKKKLINYDIATIYSFNGMMPGIGDSGFNDDTNVYKMIFINGDWKDTVITKTNKIDTGNYNTSGITIYDCDGTLQTTMCSDSQLPSYQEPSEDLNQELSGNLE